MSEVSTDLLDRSLAQAKAVGRLERENEGLVEIIDGFADSDSWEVQQLKKEIERLQSENHVLRRSVERYEYTEWTRA